MTPSQSPMTVDFNSNNRPDNLLSRDQHTKLFHIQGPGEQGGCVIIGPVLDNARSGPGYP